MYSEYLMHVGKGHLDGGHSGRYPYGSGKDPNQRSGDVLDRAKSMKAKGLSDREIAQALGMSMRDYKARYSLENNRAKAARMTQARKYAEQGMGSTAIADKMGIPESTIRGWLKEPQTKSKVTLDTTIELLRDSVDKMNYVDVGEGVASEIGVSDTKLAAASKALRDEGYGLYKIYIPQLGSDQFTTQTVLAKPGITIDQVKADKVNIGVINARINEDGTGLLGLKPVQSISSKRVMINYGDEGGNAKDGVIELRPGVKGLDMGASRYAQVRIGVDGKYYLKGMAVYSDDLPDGIDIRFNTNKPSSVPKLDVLKPMKTDVDGNVDKDNPFGSAIKPGGQRGYINIVREEGEWDKWSKNLASQMLSKQSPELAKQQLGISKQIKMDELKEIQGLTNPTVRKFYLEKYAEDCDSAAKHLKAAALPRQTSQVILPLDSIKPTEIYDPSHENGEKVVLIRYPHGGTFEIPELTVNNNIRAAKKMFGNQPPKDAVCINSKVASKLSGADFDGDTVVVIPNNPGPNGKKPIRTSESLPGLKDFDPSAAYPAYPGMKHISEKTRNTQMGIVSNLITDMTIQGATAPELERAVRHSMVVIDAYKHNLDYKRSARDNRIRELQIKYQLKPDGIHTGSSTIISRAKSPVYVEDRRLSSKKFDPETGEKLYKYTGKTKVNYKTGKVEPKLIKSTQMDEHKDAMELISGSARGKRMESYYADYANTMKSLANEARKEYMNTKEVDINTASSKQAKKVYANEVASLDAKIALAKRNKPLERKARLIANDIYKAKMKEHPELVDDADGRKKIRNMALARGRAMVNKTADTAIKPTAKEWEAIQAGAVSKTKLRTILDLGDQDTIRQLAMPKQKVVMTSAKISRAKSLAKKGYTWDEIAGVLGVSSSTVRSVV